MANRLGMLLTTEFMSGLDAWPGAPPGGRTGRCAGGAVGFGVAIVSSPADALGQCDGESREGWGRKRLGGC